MFTFALYHPSYGRIRLDNAPLGWDDFKVKIARDPEYHGVTAKFSLMLDWIKEGKEFLQSVYNQFGIQAEITAIMYELNPRTMENDEAYTGKIGLSKFVIEDDGDAPKFSANIEQSTFSQLLFNQDEIEVDLYAVRTTDNELMVPFADEKIITLHSKAVTEEVIANVEVAQAQSQAISDERTGWVYTEFKDMKINELEAFQYETGISFAYQDEPFPFIEFKSSGEVTVNFGIHVETIITETRGGFNRGTHKWFIGINGDREEVFSYTRGGIGARFQEVMQRGPTTRTYTVEKGDKLYFCGWSTVSEVSGNYEMDWRFQPLEGHFINVSALTVTEPTPCKGVMIHEAFERVVESITGRPKAFYSEFYGRTDVTSQAYAEDGPGSMMFVTNGFQLRQFPIEDRPISAEFKTLLETCDAIHNIGLGPEIINGKEVLRIENMEYYYRDDVVLDLPMVSNLKKVPMIENYYNQVEFGYNKWQNNEQGTLDEFNTKTKRTTPINIEKRAYSKISRAIASGFTLELTRRQQYKDNTTKDNTNDKELFLVNVHRVGASLVPRKNEGITLLNVKSPETIYNVDYSPTRNLLRHRKMLSPSLIYYPNKNLLLQPGEGNYKMSSMFVSEGETEPVVEDMPLKGQDLGAPLWWPEFYTFDCQLPMYMRKLLEENPYATITFKDKYGNTKKGYLYEVDVNLTTTEASWRLLRKYEE